MMPLKVQLENELYYKAGDKFTIVRYFTGGILTTGKTEIAFTLVLPKRLDNVDVKSITGNISIRYEGNYIIQNSSFQDELKNGKVRYYKSGNVLSVVYTRNSVFNYTNNISLNVEFDDLVINF